MKAALLSIVLLALPSSVVGQSVCQQLTSQVIVHKLGFTIRSVTLRSAHGLVKATAAIPDSTKPSHATVFSFSTLVGSEPQQSVALMPLAIELTKQGWSTMVIQRKLTWPDVDPSVGTMRADVMCAEQWLSKHATVTPSDWIFVGPDSDAPDPAVGDKPRMTGWLGFIVADKPGDTSTEHLFRSTAELRNWILSQHFFDN
ncbi:MAG TPA: hypothetical protein VMS18_08895 [Candidatus Binatia bacterium]|nr:hypothetical protein [Candidatus Binatia bacterium]